MKYNEGLEGYRVIPKAKLSLLVTTKLSVIIMDFEKSLFDLSKTEYGILYQNYEQIINNILWELNIITKNKEPIIECDYIV